MKKVILFCAALLLAITASHAQLPYRLDTTFQSGGIHLVNNPYFTPSWGPYVDYKVWNMVIGSDDKIIMAGNIGAVFSPNGISTDFVVTRLLPDGKIDSSFNQTGHKVFYASGQPEAKNMGALEVLSDGKIYYGGTASTAANSRMALYRINTDGSFDSQFGNGGTVRISGPNPYTNMAAMAVRQDGKILLAGNSYQAGTVSLCLVTRLNANGSVDNTFGANGSIINPFGGTDNATFHMIKLLPDNKFLVVGKFAGSSQSADDINYIARFKENGSIDSTFGINGKLEMPLNTQQYIFANYNRLETDADGFIYMTHNLFDFASWGTLTKMAVYKFTPSGNFATGFGQNGRLVIDSVYNASPYRFGTAIQNGNKLLINGMMDSGTDARYIVLRLNPDGSRDTTFRSGGQYTGTRNAFDHFGNIGLQSDNKIVFSGHGKRTKNAADTMYPVVIRLSNDSIKVEDPPQPSGIAEAGNGSSFRVYPNPVNNKLTIDGLQPGTDIRLYSMDGKAVLHSKATIPGINMLDLGKLLPGIYILELTDKNGKSYTSKILRE